MDGQHDGAGHQQAVRNIEVGPMCSFCSRVESSRARPNAIRADSHSATTSLVDRRGLPKIPAMTQPRAMDSTTFNRTEPAEPNQNTSAS